MSLIEFVQGRLTERTADAAIVSVGGIGMRLLAPVTTLDALPAVGSEVTLFAHLVVREDALTLYGFATREERSLFLQLLTVNGVGPKVALGALSGGPAAQLAANIAAGDTDALARLPGIGKRTAQRIVLDLKGKLEMPAGIPAGSAERSPWAARTAADDAAEALRGLGFTQLEIARALATIDGIAGMDEGQIVGRALQHLGTIAR